MANKFGIDTTVNLLRCSGWTCCNKDPITTRHMQTPARGLALCLVSLLWHVQSHWFSNFLIKVYFLTSQKKIDTLFTERKVRIGKTMPEVLSIRPEAAGSISLLLQGTELRTSCTELFQQSIKRACQQKLRCKSPSKSRLDLYRQF